MSSIRSILEKLRHDVESFKFDGTGNVNASVDQALKDISELIDEARPKKLDMRCAIETHSDAGAGNVIGFNSGIKQYQSNLKELLK